MRKTLYTLVSFLLLLFVLIVVAANSSWLIKKVADRFAPQYKVGYKSISGNLLTGVTIDSLTYDKKPLSQSLVFRWNPATILHRTISIHKLEVEALHLQNLEALADSFNVQKKNSSKIDEEKSSFNFTLSLDNLSLSIESYTYNDVALNSADVEAKGLVLHSDELSVKEIQTTIDTQVTVLIPGTYKEIDIGFIKFKLSDVDVDIVDKVVSKGKVNLFAESSLVDVNYEGSFKNNQLKGPITLSSLDKLIEAYQLPLSKETLKKITVETKISQSEINAEINLDAKAILDLNNSSFNVDIDYLKSFLHYDLEKRQLEANSALTLTTPYAEKIVISNVLEQKEKISYHGDIRIDELKGVDTNLTDPFKNLKITYQGSLDHLSADIQAKNLKGHVRSKDMKLLDIHLETIDAVRLSKMFKMPEVLEEAQASLQVDAPLSLENNVTTLATIKLTSNLINSDANLTLGKKLKINAVTFLPEDSLLKSLDSNVKWDALSRADIDAKLSEDIATATIFTKDLEIVSDYNLSSQLLHGKVKLRSLEAYIEANQEDHIYIKTNITSLQSLKEDVSMFYRLGELPSIGGSVKLDVEMVDINSARVKLTSPQIRYKADTMTIHKVDAVSLTALLEPEKVVLESYSAKYGKTKLFATNPSYITLEDQTIKLDSFWLNDALKVDGNYTLLTRKGQIDALGQRVPLKHELVTLNADIDTTILLDGNSTSVNGTILLVNSEIHYDFMKKSYPSDSDIIIVQDIKEKNSNQFMDNLSVNVQVKTKNPMIYKEGAANITANADLLAYKSINAPFMLLGSITLPKGGSYDFRDKKFVLEESFVHFAGDINKPILEIDVDYQAFKHLITIKVLGTPGSPNIHFSSVPSLTKEQILSVILFDSEAGAGSHTSDDMMKMMGGSVAKSALSNVGIDVDHLVIGDSVEVGKKLNDKTTIIYINDEMPKVELKYQHTDYLESVIGTGQQSSSYDIFYIKDY